MPRELDAKVAHIEDRPAIGTIPTMEVRRALDRRVIAGPARSPTGRTVGASVRADGCVRSLGRSRRNHAGSPHGDVLDRIASGARDGAPSWRARGRCAPSEMVASVAARSPSLTPTQATRVNGRCIRTYAVEAPDDGGWADQLHAGPAAAAVVSAQVATPPRPCPRSLAPRMRRTTIMITALWRDMNSLREASGPAARSVASR